MTSILEKIIKRSLKVLMKEDTLIENIKKEMDLFLPPNNFQSTDSGSIDLGESSGRNEKEFEDRIKQSLGVLPLSVYLGIALPSYLLRNKFIFDLAHKLGSTSVAQVLNASRMPLALRIDDQPRIVREGSRMRMAPSLRDNEHYFEIFTKQLDQKYDVIVIGSGPGGSEAAVAMLRKDPSLKLLLIEEGKEYTTSQLGAMTPSETFTHLYTGGGVQYALGKGGNTFPLLTGRVMGGSARVNSGTFEDVQGSFRDEVISRHFDGDLARFERILAQVKSDYSVSKVPLGAVNSTQKKYFKLAKELGYDVRTLNSSRSWSGEDACTGRAACYLGCLIGAKKSPDNVGLVEILNQELYGNAFVLGDTSAVKIQIRKRKAEAVDIINRGRKISIQLEKDGVVVVAGGAIGTAKLLLNSGIPAGDQFLCHTQTEVYRLNPEPVYADRGLPQGIMTPLKCGGTAECAHPSSGVLALLATNMHGESLRRYVEEYPQIEVLGAIVQDMPLCGSVKKSFGGTIIRYQHSERDQRLIRNTVCEMMEIWASEKGEHYFRTNVYPLFSSGDKKHAEMEKRGWIHADHFNSYRNYLGNLNHLFPTSSVHLFATAYDSVEDHATGQIKKLDNVYVTDASAMLQTKVNPQGTIYTVAHAKGEKIIERM